MDRRGCPRRHGSARARAWVAITVAALLAIGGGGGCGGDDGGRLELTRWTLHVDGRAPAEVTLPADLGARVPRADTRYDLSTTAALPAALVGRPVRLALRGFEGRVTLVADGAPATELTRPWLDGYRRRGPTVFELPADATADARLELTLTVDHRWSHSAWFGVAPSLADAARTDWRVVTADVANLSVSAAAVVVLLLMGLTWLRVYLADRERRTYLWFALEAISVTGYPLFVLGTLQHVFGRYDVPALHISLAVAITASVEFTRSYFDLRARVRWLWPACAAVSAVTLLLPDPHTGNLVTAPILVAYLAGCLGYEIVLSARETRRRAGERRARYILASWIGMAVLGVPDFAYWCGLGDLTGGARVGSLGIAMIAFWLSMVLSAEHVATLRQRAALAAELSARVVELEAQGRENAQLNRELQRQIAERSGQLADALARIARLRPDEPEALAPGAVVHDRYRVIRPIGAGGMGAVYEVERVTDGRRLALKVARRAHGEAVARLAREAQLAATVRHPHLVSVVDVDVASSGLLFLVMELVDGDSLRQLAPHHGEPSWAIPVLAQLADGLAALHASGVIHRDLKPSNVLVTTAADGDLAVKIVDFGIARQVDHDAGGDDGDDGDPLVDAPGAPPARGDVVEAEPEPPTATAMGLPPDVASPPPRPRADRLTRTGYVPGTPAYIAPELARGDAAVTTAADVYALGVIAFELLTGAPPFARPQVRLAARRERLDPLPTVDARWRDAPPALVVALRACLHPEPAGRPTAAAIATLLREARAQGAA